MNDESGFVRGGATWALGNIGDERAIEPLKKALNDKSSYVRRVAEKFLKKIQWNSNIINIDEVFN